MSTRRVLVNATSLLAGRILGAAVTLVLVAVSANALDAEDFGLVTSTLAAGFLANMFVTFGTDTVVTRAVAAQQGDAVAVATASLTLQTALALALATLGLIAWLFGAPVVVFIQALALLPLAVVTVAGAVLRGRQRMDRLVVGSTVGGLVTLGALLVGFSIDKAPWVPVAALAAGSLVTAIVLGSFASRETTAFRFSFSAHRSSAVGGLVRETLPFAGMVVLAAIGAQAGVLLVEFASDDTAGGYGVAVRLVEAARLVPAAAMGAFFPAMLSGLHKTDRYRRWLRWLVAYALAATTALLVFAGPINRRVFDDQLDGAALTRILALGLIVTVARLAWSFSMIAAGHERVVVASAAIGAVITVVGGLLVAQRFGAQGVAWSQLTGLVAATSMLATQRNRTRLASTKSATAPVGVGEVDRGNGPPE